MPIQQRDVNYRLAYQFLEWLIENKLYENMDIVPENRGCFGFEWDYFVDKERHGILSLDVHHVIDNGHEYDVIVFASHMGDEMRGASGELSYHHRNLEILKPVIQEFIRGAQ
jgi:hypothetical protein